MIITLPLFLAGLQIGSKVASTLLEEKNPKLAKNIETLVGSFTAGAQGMSSLTKAFGSPNITQTTTPTEGSGLQIGGAVGKITGDYTSKIPGVQGFGKGKSVFDPNYNANQLGIQSPYNNTDDSLFNWLGG